VDQGASRGALSLLRRTVSLLVDVSGLGQKHLPVILAPTSIRCRDSESPKKKVRLDALRI
jgi:hypothetical protein